MTPGSRYIVGWKGIAAEFDVSVRTAQRLETSAGLPVRRIGPRGGSVQVRRDELERWLGLPAGARAAALAPGRPAPAARPAAPARVSGLASFSRRWVTSLREAARAALVLGFLRPHG